MNGCELCTSMGGEVVWQDEQCRVVRVGGTEGTDYPGFCRVIWRDHVREMSDLANVERLHLMKLVFAVEVALRELYQPDKINLASLGNVTPHLHWHVIPRFTDDRNFPAPIWAAAGNKDSSTLPRPVVSQQSLHAAIERALSRKQEGES